MSIYNESSSNIKKVYAYKVNNYDNRRPPFDANTTFLAHLELDFSFDAVFTRDITVVQETLEGGEVFMHENEFEALALDALPEQLSAWDSGYGGLHVFTIGKPWTEFSTPDQNLMLMTGSFTSAMESVFDSYVPNQFVRYSDEFTGRIVLSHLNTIFKQFLNFRFIPTATQQLPVDSISINKNALIHSIKGKHWQNKTDVDFTLSDTLPTYTMLQMFPVSIQGKLTMYAPWLDWNQTLSFEEAKGFLTPAKMDTLFTGAGGPELHKMVLAHLELRAAYSKNFAGFERETNQGNIKAGQIIGGMDVAQINGKTLADASQMLVDHWKSQFPQLLTAPIFKTFKEVIAMLSQHLENNQYAVGLGNNGYNTVLLPWYFELQTQVLGVRDTDGGSLLNGTKSVMVQLKSQYFDFTNQYPHIKAGYQLSNYKVYDVDGYVSEPELPYQLTEVNRSTMLGKINVDDNSSLRYKFITYADSADNLNKLFGTREVTSTVTPYLKALTLFENQIPMHSMTIGEDINWIPNPGFSEFFGAINWDYSNGVGTPTSASILAAINRPEFLAYLKTKIGSQEELDTANLQFRITEISTFGGRTYTLKITFMVKPIVPIDVLTRRFTQSIFDKDQWNKHINNFNGSITTSFITTHDGDYNELVIQGIWIDRVRLGSTNPVDLYFNHIENETLAFVRIVW